MRLLRYQLLFIITLVVSRPLLGQPTPYEKDYYTSLLASCPASQPIFTNECKKALRKQIVFGETYLHKEFDRDRVLLALFTLMQRPLLAPMEKRIFGVVTAEDLFPSNLKLLLKQHPQQPLSQIFFNYVMNRVSRFELASAEDLLPHHVMEYDLEDRVLTVLELKEKAAFFSIVDASALLHEVHHLEVGNHRMRCPFRSDDQLDCDRGFDGSFGWQFLYLWMVLQGNEISPLSPSQTTEIVWRLIDLLDSIPKVPQEDLPLVKYMRRFRALKNRSTYSFNYLQIAKTEGLHFQLGLPDYYAQVKNVCREKSITAACDRMLGDIIDASRIRDKDRGDITSAGVAYLKRMLHALVISEWSEQGKLGQVVEMKDLIPNDGFTEKFLPGRWTFKQFLFNALSFLCHETPHWVELLRHQTSLKIPFDSIKTYEDILVDLDSKIPGIFEVYYGELLYMPRERNPLTNKWVQLLQALYQWSVLHTNEQQAANTRFLSSTSIDLLSRRLCSWGDHLSEGQLQTLPASFSFFKTIDCQSSAARLNLYQ